MSTLDEKKWTFPEIRKFGIDMVLKDMEKIIPVAMYDSGERTRLQELINFQRKDKKTKVLVSKSGEMIILECVSVKP